MHAAAYRQIRTMHNVNNRKYCIGIHQCVVVVVVQPPGELFLLLVTMWPPTKAKKIYNDNNK